ncbi:putative COOH-NH2 ligase [Pseudomonas phage K4]|uniref:COOH.NH2 ligase n=1 Tax=Pseudomonas phage O4 TaxID=1784982 RepID=UPI00078DD82C|nr:COOH.NH2 ligase [Pseudomonas phage O4]AMO43530.1 putative COOH-NH2 ligase [Pseudomonas phage O4]QWS69973.1 putative COOH-NH2 ligase [Pseudomonas phage K4]WEU69443.1 putative COOH-NH2 ligase [Pseudomonas phage vB_PaeM_Ty]
MSLNILVGADPEIFMMKGGKFVSAHGAIPGNKKEPFKVDKGAVQVDGMALEFNIDPAKDEKEFVRNLTTVMSTLKGMVPGFELNPSPVAEFGFDYIKAQPDEATELGCDPDFNAYENGAANPRPNANVDFRTGAGHVHIGWGEGIDVSDPDHIEACCMATKQLDYYLGLPSILFDKGTKRRTLYGAPGTFRPKPYGVEYRVLSNAWLKDEKLMEWVFKNTVLAIQRLFKGEAAYDNDWRDDTIKIEMAKARPNRMLVASLLKMKDIPLPPGFKFKREGFEYTIVKA